MLKKYWKKIGLIIVIVACAFNIMNKLINKLSLNKEMLQSAQYIFLREKESDEENKKSNNLNTNTIKNTK